MTQNQISYLRLNEDRRHNVVSEGTESRKAGAAESQAAAAHRQVGVGYANVAELARHNQAQEQIGWYDTQGRVLASLQQASAAQMQAEASKSQAGTAQQRANTEAAIAQENARHNQALEDIQRSGVDVQSRTADELARHNKALEAIDIGKTAANITKDLAQYFVPMIIGG